ncbi:MAG: hypothetical protein J6L88_04820 [Clostridia bacterium]|nr:hypothetical protein [Clostridia bacterium]
MADMAFWEKLYSTLLTEERAEELRQCFEEVLLKQIEDWAQEILNGIKEEVLKKARTGDYTVVNRTRCIKGDYGAACGDVACDSALYAVLLKMEATALLDRYRELRCTELPNGNKRLYFDALCRRDRRVYRWGQFGTVFSRRIEKFCADEWIKVQFVSPRTARYNTDKSEQKEMHMYYTVLI